MRLFYLHNISTIRVGLKKADRFFNALSVKIIPTFKALNRIPEVLMFIPFITDNIRYLFFMPCY